MYISWHVLSVSSSLFIITPTLQQSSTQTANTPTTPHTTTVTTNSITNHHHHSQNTTMSKLLALAALTTAALAGNAYVTNDCSYTVYVQHVDSTGSGPLVSLAAGGQYSEPVSSNPGSVLKVWNTTDTSGPLSELDYTSTTTGDYQGLYYAIGGSGNDSPFTSSGYGIIPSNVGSLSSCVWDFCSAGVENCPNFGQTKVCLRSTDELGEWC